MSRRTFLVIAGILGLAAYGGSQHSDSGGSAANATSSAPVPSVAASPDPAEERRDAERRHPEQFLEISKFSWSKSGFGSVMLASFIIANKSSRDMKDIAVRCTHSAPSGTVIDRNERTIYQIVKANSSRSVREFNMGLIHSQAKRSGCEVVSATLL